MIRDTDGAIYFMMKSTDDTIRVIRADPNAEMGTNDYLKVVFTFYSSLVYFMHEDRSQHQFYIMDDQKKVRVIEPNKETHMWKQKMTYELTEKDAQEIYYCDYAEYAVSGNIIHLDKRMYYLLESKSKDVPTWASSNFMLDYHVYVSGPKYAQRSGLIWYVEQRAIMEDEVMRFDESMN